MNWLTKALSRMVHAGRPPFLLGRLARTRFDFRKEVGDGLDSSVVTAPVQWIQRAFPEGRLRVVRGDGEDEAEVENHPLIELINRPNTFYGDGVLWAGTIFSYLTAGNAYWIKARNRGGRTGEVWYVPHWLIQPKWPEDGSIFITHYDYRPGPNVAPIRLDPDDVVHFRHGVDPRNVRLGLSPLHGAIREIFMDLEASNFVASLLMNTGVPGVVISPDGSASPTPDDVEAVKTWFKEAFGGDRRGDPLVMGGATKVQQYGFNPQQMDLSVARDVAEERVCASLGIPAAVVGFGAGLQTAKVGATMGELRKLAWHNGVIPLMRAVADELQRSFPEMLRAGETVTHDVSGVSALEEDRLTRAQAWNTMVAGGWVEVAEARAAMGLDVDDTHRIFIRPFSAIEVPAGQVSGVTRQVPEPNRGPGEQPANGDPDEPGGEQAALAMPSILTPDTRHPTPEKQTRRSPSPAQRAFVEAMERMERPLSNAMTRRLEPFFERLGRDAAEAARPLLEQEDLGQAAANFEDLKDDPDAYRAVVESGDQKQDELLAGRIIEQLELPLAEVTFRRAYEAHYLEVAREVAKAGELIGLATDLPDPVARAVVAAGGRRAGLVDLTNQSRRALFEALADGRAAGEGVDQLVERIRDHVEGGPWQSAETRARVIARTETKFAQNISTVARAQAEGVDRFIIFDGRKGPGVSGDDHIACDGGIVTAAQAEVAAAAEHPNGTLSFTPLFEDEPLGLPPGCWINAII